MRLQYEQDDRVQIDGKEYTVNASFDVILRVIDMLKDEDIIPAERVLLGMRMLIGEVIEGYTIEELNDILRSLLDEYVNFKSSETYDIDGNLMETPMKEPVFDFNEDGNLIFAAFYQTYGIDLIDMQGKLHWNKFMALFESLPSDTKFSQVVSIRSWKPSDDKLTKAQIMSRQKAQYMLSTMKGGDEYDE